MLVRRDFVRIVGAAFVIFEPADRLSRNLVTGNRSNTAVLITCHQL